MSLLQKCGVDILECDRLTGKMLLTYDLYNIDRHDIAAETSNPFHGVSQPYKMHKCVGTYKYG